MPNWCDNRLTIYHHDDYDIGRVAGKLGPALNTEEQVFDFQKINPVPEELLRKENSHDKLFTCIDDDIDVLFESQDIPNEWKQSYNVDHHAYPIKNHYPKDWLPSVFLPDEYLKQKYGSITAYDYRCEHWGTKWIGNELSVNITKHAIEMYFQTAWGPPDIVVETIIGWFPKNSYTFIAFEPGVGLLQKVEGTEMGGKHIHDVNLDNSPITQEDYELLYDVDSDYAEEWWEKDKDGSCKFKEDDIPYDN